AWLPDVADPGILLPVAMTDIRGAVCRGIVRDNQLEVPIALTEQRLEGLRKLLLGVVHGETDAQPGGRAHLPPTFICIGKGSLVSRRSISSTRLAESSSRIRRSRTKRADMNSS